MKKPRYIEFKYLFQISHSWEVTEVVTELSSLDSYPRTLVLPHKGQKEAGPCHLEAVPVDASLVEVGGIIVSVFDPLAVCITDGPCGWRKCPHLGGSFPATTCGDAYR